MELVILLFSDNTWVKCLAKDEHLYIKNHEWKNDIDLRTVTTIFECCSTTQKLETYEEWQARLDGIIKTLEKEISEEIEKHLDNAPTA